VGVDQARREDAREVDPLGVLRGWGLGRRPGPGDPAVGDVQRGIRDDGAGAVPGHEGAGGEAQSHGSRT
jgi:hypothetical protein